MKSTRVLNRRQLGFLLATIVAAATAASTMARAQDEKAEAGEAEEKDGKLYNLTNEPFVFQMHRADGHAWTDSYTIAPGKFFTVKSVAPADVGEIQGAGGGRRGYVIIRHREKVLNGWMTLRLPAQNLSTGQYQPTWFAVRDADGIARLVQEPSIEQAQAVQASLLKQKPMTLAELERSKHMLRANWVLTD